MSVRAETLLKPTLEVLKNVLTTKLESTFEECSVDIVNCPDLRELGYAQAGLGGRNIVVDVGGEALSHNPKNYDIHFPLRDIAAACGMPDATLTGAGACHGTALNGHQGEAMWTADLKNQRNNSIALRVKEDGSSSGSQYDLVMGGLGNLHLSDGVANTPVIRLRLRKRKLGSDFSVTIQMRNALREAFPDEVCGLAGVLRVLNGKVKTHVQPDYCNCPAHYFDCAKGETCKDFLQMYPEVEGEMLGCFSLWSNDPTGGAMHCRSSCEHTHLVGVHDMNIGGHYHGDVSPETIEYEAYLVPADTFVRYEDGVARDLADRNASKTGPSVIIVGAGAMGCLLGSQLFNGGMDVTLLDKWEAHVNAINKEGLRVDGKGGFPNRLQIPACLNVEDLPADKYFDVAIIQCKSNATRVAIKGVLSRLKPDAVAISFQNGLGNEEVLSEVLGGDHRVLGGQTLQGAHMEGPGHCYAHTSDLPSYMGEWRGGVSDRVSELCYRFTKAGLPTFESTNVKKQVWKKALYNCVVSPLSALTRLAHKDIYIREDSDKVADKILEEARAVAEAEGVHLTENEAHDCLAKVIASKQANTSSMCQDILAKRQTEMNFLNSFIVDCAEKHGIQVPLNRAMAFLVKGLESHYL